MVQNQHEPPAQTDTAYLSLDDWCDGSGNGPGDQSTWKLDEYQQPLLSDKYWTEKAIRYFMLL